jgi:hypothetical protein
LILGNRGTLERPNAVSLRGLDKSFKERVAYQGVVKVSDRLLMRK